MGITFAAMFGVIPVLAIGPREVISILFVVIAFLSWIFSVINGNKNQAPGPQANPRPQPRPPGGNRRENELQAEINRFLKNVMGQKPDDVIELTEDDEVKPQRKPRLPAPSQGKRAGAQPPSKKQPAQTEATADAGPRPGGRIAQRKGPGSQSLGTGVQQHLAEHMQSRVVQQAQEHLSHGVAEKVQQDLGTFSGGEAKAAPPTTTATKPIMSASDITAMLRNPNSVRQAIVTSLILNRPKFGRNRRA